LWDALTASEDTPTIAQYTHYGYPAVVYLPSVDGDLSSGGPEPEITENSKQLSLELQPWEEKKPGIYKRKYT
jgi:hypothetical protein